MRNLVLGASLVLCACGPSGRDGDSQPDAPSGQQTDGNGSQQLTSQVYAHSGSKLYQVNTQTLAPVEVGSMGGLGGQSLTDLAIDKNGKIVGITLDKLYSIDASTGTVTLIKALATSAQNFTSLSYVPTNLTDPNSSDILVSANSFGDVYQIDPTTGNASMLGNYGKQGTDQIGSSGDLIGVRNFGIYATVDIGTSSTGQDFLAKIDPVTWHATPIGSGTGYNDIFGLGFWDGVIYGFVSMGSGSGKIITIDPNTGVGHEVDSGSVRWYGAGVGTSAPIIE